jgi:transcriptional regulator with XRE-family HTH domain/dephospho-CoA kinase
MIKNERQYRITRSQAQKFQAAIHELEGTKPADNISPVLHKAQIDALRSQLADLEEEVAEYEALRESKRPFQELHSIEQIPSALIQARISSGLSQEQLAERLGMKAQQIQRYEATEYRAASLSRVVEVASALGVSIREGILPPAGEVSVKRMFDRLKSAGLAPEFVTQRLLPKAPGLVVRDEGAIGVNDVAMEVAEGVSRIYGWTPAVLFGDGRLDVAAAAAASGRFKLPARVREGQMAAYVVYAHYLGLLVLDATKHIRPRTLPQDAGAVRREIVSQYGELSFDATLKYVWSLGIPILPLNDPGNFHGACWRVGGRNVIVLKQRTRSIARWLHDLLHEYFHAANKPDLEEHPIIEESEMAPSRRESEEELSASQFAGDVMLGGRAEELAEECAKSARGSVEKLKSAVVRVAKHNNVAVDVLANYMAFRLSLQGINWWGAANNLQSDGTPTVRTPREILLSRANLVELNPIDRSLLLRALEPQVLAFAGKIGSGKSTLSEEVANALQWKRASFGDYVRTVAKSQGLETSREVLQELGAALVKRPEEFCRAMLAHYGWQSGEPLVIDGVRHKEILDALRVIVAPLEVRVVYLDIDEEKRHERLLREEEGDSKKLAQVEAHSTEQQAGDLLPKIADLKVSGDRPVEDLVRDIVTWIHQADGGQDCAA